MRVGASPLPVSINKFEQGKRKHGRKPGLASIKAAPLLTVVPFRIEGKSLAATKMVSPPLADYEALPWRGNSQDHNYGTAFLAENILHEPFSLPTFSLQAGTHLHFIVPHFLGQQGSKLCAATAPGGAKQPGNSLPPAPNCWLVSKTAKDSKLPSEFWLVESDYIYPENATPPANTASPIPYPTGRPYRFMGRTSKITVDQTLQQVLASRSPSNTFAGLNGGKPLTVIAHGDMNFSSYYPNCLGVFGFYDPDGTPGDGARYTVCGWHHNPQHDVLASYVTAAGKEQGYSLASLNNELSNIIGFTLPDNFLPNPGNRTLLKAYFENDAAPSANKTPVSVAIGNTSTEALSSYAADCIFAETQLNKSNGQKLPTGATAIEEQLEAALALSQLGHLELDLGPKFLEARHNKGFVAHKGSTLWQIQLDKSKLAKGTVADNGMPSCVIPLLATLNQLQQQYDDSQHQIQVLRQQLYFDWCKYMQASYTPSDARDDFPDEGYIRYFIEHYGVKELDSLVKQTGLLTVSKNADEANQPGQTNPIESKANYSITVGTAGASDLANQFLTAWDSLKQAVDSYNQSIDTTKTPRLLISDAPGPRYWQPTNPAILVAGLPLDSSDQYAPTKTTPVLELALPVLDPLNYQSILQAFGGTVSELHSAWQSIQPLVSTLPCIFYQPESDLQKLSAQVWNPFVLDWEMDIEQAAMGSEDGLYPTDAIKNSFKLDPMRPDFAKLQQGSGNLSVFSGSVLLSPGSRSHLLNNITDTLKTYFQQQKIKFNASNTEADFLAAASFSDALGTLDQKALANPITADDLDSALYVLWQTYKFMLINKVVAQTLNGFNQANIMGRKTSQLPMAEPVGFASAQAFTQSLKKYVQNERSMSPIMSFDFNPIRSGLMKINRLALIDNFGVNHSLNLDGSATDAKSITVESSSTASTLANPGQDQTFPISVPPRLIQPARLNFRWLSGADGCIETHSHPETSPICGFILPNYLDQTLAVYDASGKALGSLDESATWSVPPWQAVASDISKNVGNPYLLSVLQWLQQKYQTGNHNVITDFFDTLQLSLNQIAPAGANIYGSKSQLMGRPMAVVRSQLSFSIKGKPYIDQSWSALLRDLNNCTTTPGWDYQNRYNRQWQNVEMPIRLGEHHQLNDSLIGYWPETEKGISDSQFITPLAASVDMDDSDINTFAKDVPQEQWLALVGGKQTVTMLMEPRGLVHATTGFLPTKALDIPSQYYLDALQGLEIWFQTSPLLQDDIKNSSKVSVNLPQIAGYQWSWWDAYHGVQPIVKQDIKAAFDGQQKILNGWLLLRPGQQN